MEPLNRSDDHTIEDLEAFANYNGPDPHAAFVASIARSALAHIERVEGAADLLSNELQIAQAFHNVAVKERDLERARVDRMQAATKGTTNLPLPLLSYLYSMLGYSEGILEGLTLRGDVGPEAKALVRQVLARVKSENAKHGIGLPSSAPAAERSSN